MIFFKHKINYELAPAIKQEIKEKVDLYRNEVEREAIKANTSMGGFGEYLTDNYEEGLRHAVCCPMKQLEDDAKNYSEPWGPPLTLKR